MKDRIIKELFQRIVIFQVKFIFSLRINPFDTWIQIDVLPHKSTILVHQFWMIVILIHDINNGTWVQNSNGKCNFNTSDDEFVPWFYCEQMVSILSAIRYISVLMRIYYKAFYKEVRLVYKIDLKQFNNRQKSRHTCL